MTELQKSYGTLSDAQLANFVSLGDDRAFDELVVRYLDTISIIARKFSAEGYEHNDLFRKDLWDCFVPAKPLTKTAVQALKSICRLLLKEDLFL